MLLCVRMRLSGSLAEIVECAACMPNFRELMVAGNRFAGPIPDSIGRLQRLTSLDLSDNMLRGELFFLPRLHAICECMKPALLLSFLSF